MTGDREFPGEEASANGGERTQSGGPDRVPSSGRGALVKKPT